MKYLSIDVGGTFIKYGIVSENGLVTREGRIPTPQTGFDDFVAAVTRVINSEKGNFDVPAFSTLAHPEPISGYVRGFSSLPYVRDKNFKEAFYKSAGVKIEIENDGNCAALAESWLGVAKDVSTFVCMVLGTSIGGGVVKDGRLHKGYRIGACETCGMIVGYDESTGYESLQMSSAMSVLLSDLAEATGKKDVTGEWAFDRAAEGDPICAPRVERYLRGLAITIHNIVYFYDAELFAIGGGISKRPDLIPSIKKMLDDIDDRIGMERISPLVTACSFNNSANLIGAARHAMLSAEHEWSYTL